MSEELQDKKPNKGQFEKGKSGNPNGRPPGKKAEMPQDIKDFITFFVHKNMRRAQRNFDKMSPTAQNNFMLTAMKFIIAAKQETKNDGDIKINISYEDEEPMNESYED